MTNVSRIVALGGSIYRILRVSEAQESPDSYGLKRGCDCGWVRLKNLARARLRGLELDLRGLELESSEFEVWSSGVRMFGSLDVRKFGVRMSGSLRDLL